MTRFTLTMIAGPGLALAATMAWAAPEHFPTPDDAAAAVAGALETQDATALVAIFGTENRDVILTGNDGDDRETWRRFLDAYQTFHRVDPDGPDQATLTIGRDLWPFPAPLVKSAEGWSFDAAAARRRCGCGGSARTSST